MMIFLAQQLNINTTDGTQTIKGPLPDNINSIGAILNIILPFMFSLAGILLFLFMAWGGYDLLLSQGEPGKVKSGKSKITSALIGFILLVLSYFLAKVIAQILGLNAEFL